MQWPAARCRPCVLSPSHSVEAADHVVCNGGSRTSPAATRRQSARLQSDATGSELNVVAITRTLGLLFTLFSATLVPPLAVSAIYGDGELVHFAVTWCAAVTIGASLWLPFYKKPVDIRNREGFVIVALTWIALLQFTGVFNEFFRAVGLTQFVLNWLGDVRLVKNALVLINLWQFTGVGMVILLAGITSIPTEILESARLDGAVGWTLIRHITIPLIMPAITVNLLIGITGGLRLLELPLIMTKGGPRNASETIMMNIYNNAFGYERYGVASAMGLVFFVVIASITAVQLFLTRRNEVQY